MITLMVLFVTSAPVVVRISLVTQSLLISWGLFKEVYDSWLPLVFLLIMVGGNCLSISPAPPLHYGKYLSTTFHSFHLVEQRPWPLTASIGARVSLLGLVDFIWGCVWVGKWGIVKFAILCQFSLRFSIYQEYSRI